MSDDEPYNSSLEAAEDMQDALDTLIEEVKRLQKIAFELWCMIPDEDVEVANNIYNPNGDKQYGQYGGQQIEMSKA